MPLVFAGRSLGVSLALLIGVTPVIPPEHVHQVEDHGRHHNLVHRHAAPHPTPLHSAEHQARLDDDDQPILTLDAVFTVTPIVRVPVAVHTSTAMPDAPRVAAILREPGFFERLIHGPPRAPAGLRAPPFATFL